MPVLEKTIEAYLVRQVAKIGGVAEKFTSPNRRSVPDRLVLLPAPKMIDIDMAADFDRGLITDPEFSNLLQRTVFVEVKAPGKKATEAQARDHEKRRAMGFRVDVIDTKKGVDEFIRSVT
jgi:hypothetical protein